MDAAEFSASLAHQLDDAWTPSCMCVSTTYSRCHLKINEKTAYKLAAEDGLSGFKVGGSWRFYRPEIANWIMRRTEGQREGGKG